MKKQSKERLFEVMGRLDKTFKSKLNEEFEEIEATDDVEVPTEITTGEVGGEEIPSKEKELTPEEKLSALTAKIDSLYAMVHGDEQSEEDAEAKEEEIEGELNDETSDGESEEIVGIAEGEETEKKPDIPVVEGK